MYKEDAIEHYGSTSALAEALGISVQAIYMWDERVPELRAYQIERLTGGALRACDPEPASDAE